MGLEGGHCNLAGQIKRDGSFRFVLATHHGGHCRKAISDDDEDCMSVQWGRVSDEGCYIGEKIYWSRSPFRGRIVFLWALIRNRGRVYKRLVLGDEMDALCCSLSVSSEWFYGNETQWWVSRYLLSRNVRRPLFGQPAGEGDNGNNIITLSV